MFRRLLSDKEIGKRLGKRFYSAKSSDIDIYSSNLIRTNYRQFTQYNIDDILCDTISTQNDDIKHLKKEIIDLHEKINKLKNTVNNTEEKFMNLSSEVYVRLNYLTNRCKK